jgi:DNA polymerase-1
MKIKPASPEAYRLIHDGTLALSQVESNGFRIDLEYLERTRRETQKKISEYEKLLKSDPIWNTWRKRFNKPNLGSRQQFGTIIFDVLGHKRKKSFQLEWVNGQQLEVEDNKNDESAFEDIRKSVPFVNIYLEMQRLEKADGTFLGGIHKEVVIKKKGAFLHPNYNLNVAASYRSSANDPNSQNWPIRNADTAGLIRRCFIPRKGHHMMEIDIKGAEVRVGYCYHKDPMMRRYLLDETTDMHRDMASQIYMVPPNEVDKNMRYCGKNMYVFPQFYGDFYISCAKAMWEAIVRMSLKTVSGRLVGDILSAKGIKELGLCDPAKEPQRGTFEYHMKNVEQDFWTNRFGIYGNWKKKWYDNYRKRGYFQMYTGFVVYGLYRKNQVINFPVQGAAFHCLLWGLIELQRWMRKHKMRSKIVGQIHDSLVIDAHKDEVADIAAYAHKIFSKLLPKAWSWINIPIEIELELAPLGAPWHDKKPYHLN